MKWLISNLPYSLRCLNIIKNRVNVKIICYYLNLTKNFCIICYEVFFIAPYISNLDQIDFGDFWQCFKCYNHWICYSFRIAHFLEMKLHTVYFKYLLIWLSIVKQGFQTIHKIRNDPQLLHCSMIWLNSWDFFIYTWMFLCIKKSSKISKGHTEIVKSYDRQGRSQQKTNEDKQSTQYTSLRCKARWTLQNYWWVPVLGKEKQLNHN